jgi:hypothetical protein
VLRDDSLGIDASYEGRAYSGTLTRKDQTWDGILRSHDGMEGQLSGKLYQESSIKEDWLFFGNWIEDGVDYIFWADLEAEDSN